MKKTLTIQTISFKQQKNKKEQSPLHATYRMLSRAETVITERESLGSKMTKRLSQKNYCRRLSINSPLKTSKNSKKLFQNSNLQSKKSENTVQYRYKNAPVQQKQDLNHSALNFKLSSHHFQPGNSLNEGAKKIELQVKEMKKSFDQSMQLRKNRVKSQPNNSTDLKKQLMNKVSKKLQILRKMTIQSDKQAIHPINFARQTSKTKQRNNLFDKMYDHCLKKLNKDIVLYEKNLGKGKDQKYYELKIESNMLTKELVQIRKNIMKNIQDGQNQSNMGVVGNVIGFNKTTESFKMNRKKSSKGCCEKRNLKTRYGQLRNPFAADTRGWEIGEKQDQFYLCE